jgi:hypothetical protein
VQAAPPYMATYHQYSEIVAAYGYRLPPPPQAQASRVGLALLYAAIGVALGTCTGTALAVATLPPEASMLTPHLTFAKSLQSGLHIHSIANAGQPPVIQIHASNQVAAAVPAPAAPASAVQDHSTNTTASSANPSAAPTLLIHQAPALPSHANSQSASASPNAAPAPAALKPVTALASSPAPAISVHPSVQASNSGHPQILTLAPVVHPAPVVHARSVNPAPSIAPVTSPAPTIEVASTEPVHILNLQPIQKSDSATSAPALSPLAAAPLATPAKPQPPAAPSAALPSASLSSGLDGGFRALAFYSEGDATVVSYDAAGDTITTDDGRTFVIGSTVSVSHAQTWQDYRANVHYRCDQNGNCSLVRTGVIALNAKLL